MPALEKMIEELMDLRRRLRKDGKDTAATYLGDAIRALSRAQTAPQTPPAN